MNEIIGKCNRKKLYIYVYKRGTPTEFSSEFNKLIINRASPEN